MSWATVQPQCVSRAPRRTLCRFERRARLVLSKALLRKDVHFTHASSLENCYFYCIDCHLCQHSRGPCVCMCGAANLYGNDQSCVTIVGEEASCRQQIRLFTSAKPSASNFVGALLTTHTRTHTHSALDKTQLSLFTLTECSAYVKALRAVFYLSSSHD